MTNDKVITRFCPSPTGFFHIGSARTALFAWAFAKANAGECVFRCEDTDAERSKTEFLEDIVNGLNWLGLDMKNLDSNIKNMQDNVDVCQRLRKDIYKKYANQLIESGHARTCEETGAILFNMEEGKYSFMDLILGPKSGHEPEKEFAIIKADGNAAFHFAVVVDDIDAGVTHVFRGQDHLSNTPKHVALYQALGVNIPLYAHMPLIMDTAGKKLSKRDPNQKVRVSDYKEEGFLPEAMINYLCHLGWSHPKQKDIFTKDDFVARLKVKNMTKSQAKFDLKKMLNINGKYIEMLIETGQEAWIDTLSSYLSDYQPEFFSKISKEKIEEVAGIVGSRVKKMEDFVQWAHPFITESIDYNAEDFKKFIDNETGQDILDKTIDLLQIVDIWNEEEIMMCFEKVMEMTGHSRNKVVQPIRVAVCGSKQSPPIDKTLILLGKDESLERIAKVSSIQ